MIEFPLSKGGVALVDAEDVDRLMEFTWFWWKPKSSRTPYAVRPLDGSPGGVYMHRFILGLPPRRPQVDHRDTDGLNNQKSNLRTCTDGQNKHNLGMREANTSGFKGVTFHVGAGKYMAQIRVNGRHLYLGLYQSAIDAAKVYDSKAIESFGEYARTNRMLGLL